MDYVTGFLNFILAEPPVQKKKVVKKGTPKKRTDEVRLYINLINRIDVYDS